MWIAIDLKFEAEKIALSLSSSPMVEPENIDKRPCNSKSLEIATKLHKEQQYELTTPIDTLNTALLLYDLRCKVVTRMPWNEVGAACVRVE